jgi:hypothetical protein
MIGIMIKTIRKRAAFVGSPSWGVLAKFGGI